MIVQLLAQVSVRGVLTPPLTRVDLPPEEAEALIARGHAAPVDPDPVPTAEAPASSEPEEA